jgi:hypothetical protein
MADPPPSIDASPVGFELGPGFLLFSYTFYDEADKQLTLYMGSYDYLNDTWQKRSSTTLITADLPAGVFTGSWDILWGGWQDTSNGPTNKGAVYDFASDRWTQTTLVGAPPGRVTTAAWTGSQFAIWGGISRGSDFGDGALYDPKADKWTTISTLGSPAPRDQHMLVWTGSRLLVWGGFAQSAKLVDGGLYDPASDSWAPVAPAPFDPTRAGYPLWSGSRLFVVDSQGTGASGWLYDPLADRWTSVSAPQPRLSCYLNDLGPGRTAQAGDIVFPSCQRSRENVLAKLTPETNQWTVLDLPPNAPEGPQVIWTGTRWILWGGFRWGPPPPNTCAGEPGCDPPGPSMIPANDAWTLVP